MSDYRLIILKLITHCITMILTVPNVRTTANLPDNTATTQYIYILIITVTSAQTNDPSSCAI